MGWVGGGGCRREGEAKVVHGSGRTATSLSAITMLIPRTHGLLRLIVARFSLSSDLSTPRDYRTLWDAYTQQAGGGDPRKIPRQVPLTSVKLEATRGRDTV